MTSASSGDLEARLKQIFDGRYNILQELLGGGMSRVFLAEDVSLGRRIVLKILPPEISADVNRDRFRREIGFAARLQHPHIVPLLAAGEEGGLLYYTMPYIDGLSLKATIAGGKQMRPTEVVSILIDVCDALQYAHREGVVHRDIKPANLLIKERHVVVTDFGVAKALTTARGDESTGGTHLGGHDGIHSSSNITTTGLVIGTPAYMAPEQIAGDGSADHRVDIYAVGLLGYELLCGHAPFRGASPAATIAAQLTKTPDPIAQVRPDVPPILAALISRCLEKEPSHRPSSADAVLEVLRTMDLASGTHPTGAHSILKPWYKRGSVYAIAAVAIAVAGGAWSQLGKPKASEHDTVAVAPVVDSAALKIAAGARADSAKRAQYSSDSSVVARAMRDSATSLRKRFAQDSVRSASALAEMESRLFAKLKDSVQQSIRQASIDSANKRNADLAEAKRITDSLRRVSRGANFPVNFGTTLNIPGVPPTSATAEAFLARRQNLGAPRRVAVGLFSGLPKTAEVVITANALRDTIVATLKAQSRYVLVPIDSFNAAQQKTKTYDSISAMLHTELFVVISATNIKADGDSVRWSLQLRDMTAANSYSTRTVSGARASSHDGLPKDLNAFLEKMTLDLKNLDYAPRAPGKS